MSFALVKFVRAASKLREAKVPGGGAVFINPYLVTHTEPDKDDPSITLVHLTGRPDGTRVEGTADEVRSKLLEAIPPRER